MATTVLICDDAPGFAVLARTWVSEDPELEVVDVVNTAADAVIAAAKLTPDVILLDRTLPDATGVDDVVARLEVASPTSSIVLMSSLPPDRLAEDARRVGAVSSLPKTASADELRAILRAVGS